MAVVHFVIELYVVIFKLGVLGLKLLYHSLISLHTAFRWRMNTIQMQFVFCFIDEMETVIWCSSCSFMKSFIASKFHVWIWDEFILSRFIALKRFIKYFNYLNPRCNEDVQQWFPAMTIISYCIFSCVQHRTKMSTTMTRSLGINRKVGSLTHTVTFGSPLQNLVNIVLFFFTFNFNLEKLCWCLNFIVYWSRLTYS